jgi:hypothetical protein
LFLELQLEGLGHVELAEPSLIGKPLGESSIKWMSQTFKMSIQHHLVHRTQIKIVDILSIDSTCPSASTQIEKKLCNQFFFGGKKLIPWKFNNLSQCTQPARDNRKKIMNLILKSIDKTLFSRVFGGNQICPKAGLIPRKD